VNKDLQKAEEFTGQYW